MGPDTLLHSRRDVLVRASGIAAGLVANLASGRAPAIAQTRAIRGSLANAHEPGNVVYRAHEEFVRLLKEKTKGEIDIRVVGSSQLGTGRAAIEGVQSGTIEFSHCPNGNLSAYEQSRMLFDLPFIFRDSGHMAKVMAGPIGRKSADEVERKVDVTIVMEGIYEGPRVVFNRARAINTPDDLKDLKIRVIENPIYLATFRALGANAVPMAFTELYLALQQGTLDGAENVQPNILAAKFHEVCKYISRTNHFCPPTEVIASTIWMRRLSEDQRKAVFEAGREATAWQQSQWAEAVKKSEQELAQQGAIINSPPSLEPFQKNVESVWREYESRVGGRQKIEEVAAVQ